MVFLKVQPYSILSMSNHKHQKVVPRYFGSYYIVHRIGKVAYKLNMSKESQINLIFHILCLKRVIGANTYSVLVDTLINEDLKGSVKPKAALNTTKDKVMS